MKKKEQMQKPILFSDYMTGKEISAYIEFDREIAQASGLKHYLCGKDIRHIRNSLANLYNRTQEFGYDGWDFTLVHAEYDDELWKRFIPNEFFTPEEKREIEDDMWIHCPPSMYDCTGHRFTFSIRFFEVPAGTWIYHHISYDL